MCFWDTTLESDLHIFHQVLARSHLGEDLVRIDLARIFHEWSIATPDMGILPGVLGFCTMQRTVQVRLGRKTLRLADGKPIFTFS
jgi:hypothetical protein